ncbi:MAG: DUF4416 family protein [Candidatus Omnitrophota bacterium]|nr:MAG: DUF4416 family protein [Candidatus Omnitrophota bacterium]
MLYPSLPSRVKVVTAFIYSREQVYNDTKKILQRKFGDVDFESAHLEFNFTNYYSQEMGERLFRRFISFKRLVSADALLKIKLFCINIEKKFAVKNKRKINIDPGYLNEAKLVLATTKDFYHRLYLGKGIYAEVTLYYRGRGFCDFATTYPDYRTPQYKKVFEAMRDIYRQQIKKV